ncbi:lipoamide acyltransferase component of branched-chain alpha-keto acid dehydrogenase complex, mitochondrial isoform X1 [Orussus abietinus]|uniref:lipoamide acyltransferase component of branched-chain alpha-keto acid dehydrogenase complex, mitochondrial isoform X1 n=1 Tax=Orussus abietinus TaxID=222816 RepID=UPI000626E147|nr:lipoamide acyltransferase component of branched-chain alpha-keto acid dehydrogenase complex, mitochondrial isoform X1 [Orussus abietinus]
MASVLGPSVVVLLSRSVRGSNRRFLFASLPRYGVVVPFKLTDIGEGIREVTVKEWFVKPGDRIVQFDNVCEVQSDKASVTITSRYDGLVKKLHYEINDVALVGKPLVDIEVENETSETEAKDAEFESKSKAADRVAGDEILKGEDQGEKVLTTPAVRRLAMENKINLKEIPATGRNGRVMKEDVLAFIRREARREEKEGPEKPGRFKEGEVRPLKGYAKHMWKTMTRSVTIPHFVYSDECRVSELLEFRNRVKDVLKERGVTLTLMPFFVKAVSKALEEFPQLNAWLEEESQATRVFEGHDIGVAIDTPEGLVVPSIKDVGGLTIVQIAEEMNRLQALGKNASFSVDDLRTGTFTISNIGAIGGTYMKPVILSPQIAIGAIGKIERVPKFNAEDKVVPCHCMRVSWAADHRVVDGATMARFSNLWKRYVENPAELVLGL